MCRRVECRQCGRPSFAGCGMHIEQVLGDVPKADRCRCRETKAKATKPEPPRARRSWLASLLGK